MVLIHQRAPPQRATISKIGGRLTQAPAGTNSTNGQAVVIFERGHVPEVSSTSRPTASRRPVPQVVLRPVGGCGTGDVITVRFPWVCCPQSGVFLSYPMFLSASWWCIFTFRPPRRAWEQRGVSGPLGARSPCLRCSSAACRSMEESSEGLFQGVTARTDSPFGISWLMAPDAFD